MKTFEQLEFAELVAIFITALERHQRMTRGGPRRVAAPVIDARTRDHERGRSKATILRIVEQVAELRGVGWEAIFSRRRECERVASARTLAMAACAAAGVPLCHVARAFSRTWETVYSAETNCSRRYRTSAGFRREWQQLTGGKA